MDHRLQMGLLIAFLIMSSVTLGIIVSKGTIPGSFGKAWKSPTITAGIVAAGVQPDSTPSPAIACSSHHDCNDRISSTIDLCKNPGTEFSLCVNTWGKKK